MYDMEKHCRILELDKVLALLERGRLDLSPMLTDRFPFSQVEEAFAAVTERNESRIKVMVDFE